MSGAPLVDLYIGAESWMWPHPDPGDAYQRLVAGLGPTAAPSAVELVFTDTQAAFCALPNARPARFYAYDDPNDARSLVEDPATEMRVVYRPATSAAPVPCTNPTVTLYLPRDYPDERMHAPLPLSTPSVVRLVLLSQDAAAHAAALAQAGDFRRSYRAYIAKDEHRHIVYTPAPL